jgi:hypothetical protein
MARRLGPGRIHGHGQERGLGGERPVTGFPRDLVSPGAQFSADGTLKRVLYHRAYTSRFIASSSSLTTDPSGSHPLLGWVLARCTGNVCSDGPSSLGWIGGGTFRPLTSYANWLSLAAW